MFDINGLATRRRLWPVDRVWAAWTRVASEAGSGEELMPLETDFDSVRRSRERDLLSLGQPLKSFRDKPAEFSVYQAGT